MHDRRFIHGELVLGVAALLLGMWVAGVGWAWSTVFWGLFIVVGVVECRMRGAFVVLLLLLGLVGWQRYELAIPVFDSGDLAYFQSESESITWVGWIVDYPDVRDDRIKLTVEAVEPLSGRALVTVRRYPEYSYGQALQFTGVLQAPAEFEDFSYRHYLRRYGIDSVMYYPSVTLLEDGSRWDWRFWVYALKGSLESRLNDLFVEPHASFSAGLLLGSRRGIPDDLMEDFNASGLTHIIAISGYNITLIIIFVSGLLRRLSKRAQIAVATGVIGLFVILVGATAAVVRAAIMGVLGLWAIWFGRPSEVTRLLALTAAAMSLWNPFILVDDVGFQLSFAATCGLVYATPFVERFLKRLRVYDRLPEWFSIREALVTTLAAQAFAFPILMAHFDRFSLISPFANVAAVSFIPLAMLVSFVALIVSYFWWELGLLAAYGAWFFLELIIQIAQLFAQIPFATV